MPNMEIMEGARNYIKFSAIGEGDEVLIVASNDADQTLIEAVEIAAQEAGANVSTSRVRPPIMYFREPPAPIAEAMCAADAVLDIGAFVVGHGDACIRAMMEYATKMIILSPPTTTPAVLASPAARFPLDLFYDISRKVHDMCQSGKTVRVTSPLGINLTAKIDPEQTGGLEACLSGAAPGDFNIFPPGILGFIPPKDTNGVAVFESYSGFGELSKPIKKTWQMLKTLGTYAR